jgi:hypothetical protein
MFSEVDAKEKEPGAVAADIADWYNRSKGIFNQCVHR